MIQEHRKPERKKVQKNTGRVTIPKDVTYTVQIKDKGNDVGQFSFTKQGKEKLINHGIKANKTKYRWVFDDLNMNCYFRNGERGQFNLCGDPGGKTTVQMAGTLFPKSGMKKAMYFDFHHNTAGDHVKLDNGEEFKPDFWLSPCPVQPIPNENIHPGRNR